MVGNSYWGVKARSVDVWRLLVLGMSPRATALASARAELEREMRLRYLRLGHVRLGHGGTDVVEMIHRAADGRVLPERDIEALAVRDRVVQPIAGPCERSGRSISRG